MSKDKEMGEMVPTEVLAEVLTLSTDHVGLVMSNIKTLTAGFKEWLEEDVDYTRKLFGRSDKPSLLDPGTAKMINFFRTRPMHRVLKHILETEEGKELVKYVIAAELIHPASGHVVAEGVGSCSTNEVKYQYRWYSKSRLINEHGYTEEEVETLPSRERGRYVQYRIRNPEILDLDNTILKMAAKRAEMDAALQLPGVAAVFTQDLGEGTAARKHVEATQVTEAPLTAELESLKTYLSKEGVDIDLLEFQEYPDRFEVTPVKFLGDLWDPMNEVFKSLGGDWTREENKKLSHWRLSKPKPFISEPTEAETPEPTETDEEPSKGAGSYDELHKVLSEYVMPLDGTLTIVPQANGFGVEAEREMYEEEAETITSIIASLGGKRVGEELKWFVPLVGSE